MIKRMFNGFIYASFFGMFCNLMIELVVRKIANFPYSPITPEYIALFPSITVAYGADLLLYGVIGCAFSGFLFVYELDKIGYVLQSILYFVLTGIIWIPIITFLWQLWKYPEALLYTIVGFIITNGIMMFLGYQKTKKNIEEINKVFLEA